MWEDACYRCSERGTLLQCDLGMCPKVYHPLCVGKEAMPRGKWHCPWHYCVECGVLVPASGAWCRHCPNAYWKAHKDKVILNEVLGALCVDHEEELEFLLDCVRASTHGMAEILPCPSHTPSSWQCGGRPGGWSLSQLPTQKHIVRARLAMLIARRANLGGAGSVWSLRAGRAVLG